MVAEAPTLGIPSGIAPGEDAIPFKATPFAAGRAAMLDALARDTAYLRDLNTRDPADPTVAILDAAAVGGEVLAFTGERIANEFFLRTATDVASLRRLGRLVDYELRPGKAAEAHLHFRLETAPGAPFEVVIPRGTRVNSIPGPGETMVAYETMEEITARGDRNAMRPILSTPQTVADVAATATARCVGLLSAARRGDVVLLADAGAERLLRIEAIDQRPAEGVTELRLAANAVRPQMPAPPARVVSAARDIVGPLELLSQPALAREVLGAATSQRAFEGTVQASRRGLVAIMIAARRFRSAAPTPPLPDAPDGLFRMRTRTAIFGHNAVPTGQPLVSFLDDPLNGSLELGDQLEATNRVALDGEVAELRPGGRIAFIAPAMEPFIARVALVDTITAVLGSFSGRSTEVTLDRSFPTAWMSVSIRRIAVYADPDPLALAPLPVTEPVAGSSLLLDDYHPGFPAGRPVAVTGERSDLPGVVETEIHVVSDVTLENGLTRLELATAIVGPFARDTVAVAGNLARATHGEAVAQPIGHGNGAVAWQRFRLPAGPLTHVGAETPTGLAAELDVFVDGIRWREVPSFLGSGPADRVYVLRQLDGGVTEVETGDGETGSRVPTGINNVVARWRKGSGVAGQVKAGQLSLPANVPQGVRGVANPLPSAGAADGERIEDARANIPLGVLTLGRIVTLADYADFARAFAGVAKASAHWAYAGLGRAVILTVAGDRGAVIDPAGRDMANLRAAIASVSDRTVRVIVEPFRPAFFRLEANLRILPDRIAADVLAAAEAALRARFGFDARALGQPVARSEVIAALQAVDGIDWVDLDALWRGETITAAAVLPAASPRSGTRFGSGALPVGAELLTLDPGPITLRPVP